MLPFLFGGIMQRERLFRPSWGAKSLLMLAVGLLALGLLAFVAYQIYKVAFRTRQVNDVVNVEPDARIESEWSLGNFSRVAGTDYVMAPAHSKQTYQASYYEKDASAVRNYIFVNVMDKSSRWLVPTNKYLFLTAEKLLLLRDTGAEMSAGTQTTSDRNSEVAKWMSYEVVKSDTNGDGRLTGNDLRAIAISSATGEGYAEVIQNVEQTLGSMLRGGDTLLVFHSTGGRSYVSEVDLPKRQVTVTRELPKIQPQ
jgi:hypothetical protein